MAAPSAAAAACPTTPTTPVTLSAPLTDVRIRVLRGYAAPGTPSADDKVGVIETGPRSAHNILILVPGTSAAAAYFEPLAQDIVRQTSGWQVWSVERRENFLEDQSVLDAAKAGHVTPQQLFDYYLGYLTNPAITTHFQLIPDSTVGFARQWGMKVAVEDLHAVVLAAERHHGKVVLGGHSLGGAITTAYATWDFGGHAGASNLAGLVYDDGASGPTAISAEQAQASLQSLQAGSPWLAFGGITAPYAGIFNSVGSVLAKIDPNGPSVLQASSLIPSYLKPPVLATNEAGYGYALDTKTSPPSLKAAQAHLGHLARCGDPRPWDDAGELTPVQRYADMFAGTGLVDQVGTAWYHPLRLTIDAGAVADGNANPAQAVLAVDAVHGHDLPKTLRIYAFGAALGGAGVLDATRTLAEQSGIPAHQVTLVNRSATYAHNDPAGASPRNAFLHYLVAFLDRIA